MCGICGKVTFDRFGTVEPSLVRSMLGTMEHRGPDGDGIHVSSQVGLGHKRLAIIDLSLGQQPLTNEDGTVWVTFNGEIYNYQELRSDLLHKGHKFKTNSDTEVLVHLYEEYGPGGVERLRGMFAYAIWDSKRKSLFIARDRVGIKPLYYHHGRQSLVFASEIKAILADPEIEAEIIPEMIDRFLTFYYMPGEETLFKNILKLPPGCYMVVENGKVTVKKYWDLNFTTVDKPFKQATEELTSILEESVKLHMISDVPVGFLLSGGVDSTAVLGYARGISDKPLSSYTLGFDAPGIIDERPYARLAAKAYNSEHHELTISSREFQDFLPSYVWHMEEPVCEPPAIALYYVSKLAKNHVKVLLSGEGGDEAFGGYQNYRSMLWLERLKSALGPFKGAASAGMNQLSKVVGWGKLKKFGPLFNMPLEQYYLSRTSSPFTPFNARISSLYSGDFMHSVDKRRSLSPMNELLAHCSDYDVLSKMLYIDTKTWLTDDLLLKADKMTMANSIELRVPLLDHKLLEFAATLPGNFKVHNFTTKYIAKQVLSKKVPQEILDRRKTGFPVPYSSWLRKEMKGWLNDLLFDRKSVARGYFDKGAIERLVSDNADTGTYSKELFSLATLELWHRTFLNGRGVKTGAPDMVTPGVR